MSVPLSRVQAALQPSPAADDFHRACITFGWPHAASVGCLLRCVREAWGDLRTNPQWRISSVSGEPDHWAMLAGGASFRGATEHEALCVALEAAPQGES